jgi:hypothetical protein
VHLERDGKVRPGLEEAAYPKFRIPLQPENINLHRVHHGMKQGTLGQALIESDDVEEGD